MPHFPTAADIAVAVIGYSGAFNMGRSHLEQAAKAGMRPAAVVDLDPARLAAARQDFPGIETYTSVEEMLARSSARLVVAITPHNTHHDLAMQCLAAGRHVICEKPFAITTAECDALIARARQAGLFISTYHNRHWDGSIMHAVETVVRGKTIGEVVRVDCHMGSYGKPKDWWRSSRTISGGILYDWGVHLLEYALQLIDGEISEVTGFARSGHWGPQIAWKDDSNEDEAQALVRFADGRWLSLLITTLDANPRRGMLTVTGTAGTYILDYNDWELIQPQADGTTRITRGKNPEKRYELFYQNVADHLVRGEQLVITPEWARRPIHIIDLAVRSAREGRAIAATCR